MCLTLSCWRGSGWPLKVCSLSLVEGRRKKVKNYMQFDLELSQLRESQEIPLRLCFSKDRLTVK